MKKLAFILSLSIITFSISSCSNDDDSGSSGTQQSQQDINRVYATNNIWDLANFTAVLASDGSPVPGIPALTGTLDIKTDGTYEMTGDITSFILPTGTWEFNGSSATEVILNSGTADEIFTFLDAISENDMKFSFTTTIPLIGAVNVSTDWDPLP